MPGSSGPVQLARLPDLDDGRFRAFVRFPRGWSREGPGHYPVKEEFIVLEGTLAIGDKRWQARDIVCIPAHAARSSTRAGKGCLAFAAFEGAPRWQPSQSAEAQGTVATAPHSWMTEQPRSFHAPCDLEGLALADYTWMRAERGELVDVSSATFWRGLSP